MTIKQATKIALYGNAAVLAITALGNLGIFRMFGGLIGLLLTLASTGTLVLFLYTLNRKQP